jgi:thiamine-monophosphate kinase
MSPSIASLGERDLIDRLQGRAGAPPDGVIVGIGDDAAVIAPARNRDEVVTTDSLVEHVHFRRDWSPMETIGYKALAVNLSDLAAMGATPRASLLSLALPDDFTLAEFDALADGYLGLARASGAALVGGNMTRSPGPVVIGVTAVGAVGHRRVLRRSGARAGDALFVTGSIGAAAAGLAMFQAGSARSAMEADRAACVLRFEQPEPRLRCGVIVGRTRAAAAAIDLSDGLADAAWRLAEASGVGVVLQAADVPVHAGALEWAREAGIDPVGFALAGGEDYELAFAVSRRRRARLVAALKRCPGLALSCVGTFVAEPGAWLERNGDRAPLPRGFAHF